MLESALEQSTEKGVSPCFLELSLLVTTRVWFSIFLESFLVIDHCPDYSFLVIEEVLRIVDCGLHEVCLQEWLGRYPRRLQCVL
jgi:hypothetical protein